MATATPETENAIAEVQGTPAPLPSWVAAALVFLSAAAVLVLEIVSMRLVAPYVGLTLETSSAVIGVALAAIAVGAWAGGWLADRVNPRLALGPVLGLAGVTSLLVLPVVRVVGEAVTGQGTTGVIWLTGAAIILPAALMSAVAPLVVKLQLSSLRETGATVGRYSSLGTLGAILATFGTGFVLLATMSHRAIVLSVGIVVTVLGIVVSLAFGRRTRAVTAAGVTVLAVGAGTLSVLTEQPCQWDTEYHCANIVADPARPSGRTLLLDMRRHSYVDLADPTFIQFTYAKVFASAVDIRPAGPVSAVHIGGGGGTLPRYVDAVRPGSRNQILEIDGKVLELDQRELGLQLTDKLTAKIGDARTSLREEAPGSQDFVFGDAFSGLSVPWHLTTREVAQQVSDVLRPDGVYALNVIDNPPLKFLAAELATLRSVFAHVEVIGYPRQAAGSLGGNFSVFASQAPMNLDALTQRMKERGLGTVVATDAQVDALAQGGQVLTDNWAPVDQLLTIPA